MMILLLLGRSGELGSSGMPRADSMISVAGYGCQREPMADIIWAMKTLRLTECGYPFRRCFPLLAAWFERVSSRPSFQEGVMGKHRLMSKAFRAKARIEHILGIGLQQEVSTSGCSPIQYLNSGYRG